jgi:hypothetical protein
MFDKIYSNGCSFMWGHHHNNPWYFKYFEETKDIDISKFLEECKNHNQQKENTQYTNPNVFQPFNEFDWVRVKYNYANRVAEGFGVELINESIFGGSLHRLIRKTTTYIIETSDEDLQSTLFLLELPPAGRGEMYFENQNRYVNFAGDIDFDFIKKENFELIQNWYEKSFNLQIDIFSEFQKLYLLINLLKSKNIQYIFVQTNHRIEELNSLPTKYGNKNSFVKIQNEINNNSVKFITSQGNTYDLVHWFTNVYKTTFSNDTNGMCKDGHNSIKGSRVIAEQIIKCIKKKYFLNLINENK